MIWIIGEYAERIDNADELLESFLEGFHDENTQVNINMDILYLGLNSINIVTLTVSSFHYRFNYNF